MNEVVDEPVNLTIALAGNSNVGKSSITRLLLPNPRILKGKTGKKPGSTVLIKSITHKNLPFQIVDLPGFGFMKHSSQRRAEHNKKQIVIHVEKHHSEYFLALIVLNVLRIQDEINKYFIQDKNTIPLSFELIKFLEEFNIPLLLLINKIDKLSKFDMRTNIDLFLKSAEEFGIKILHLDKYLNRSENEIPYLEFSALKKTNLDKLKKFIRSLL